MKTLWIGNKEVLFSLFVNGITLFLPRDSLLFDNKFNKVGGSIYNIIVI